MLSPVTPVSAKAQEILASVDYHRPPNLINADPPRHTKIRRFVQQAMSPRRLRAMEPIVREWAEPRIREMAEAGSADIVGDLAFPLPALTGFRILGSPLEDLEMLKSWCGDRFEFTYGRARLESRIASELFATLTPTMHVVPDQEIEFAPNIMLRGPKRLLVKFP